MTSSFLSEANKLKNIQLYLEKTDNLLTHLSKYECEFDICDHIVNLEKSRKNETDLLNAEVRNIWRLLKTQKTLLQEENVNSLDLRSFKKEMINIQEKIHVSRIKLMTNIDMLKDQEKGLWEINNIYNQRLPEWEKPIKTSTDKNIIQKSISSSNHKEVKEFMDFVNKSNGHENGWSSEDHLLFLKFRNKYKNVDSLAIHLHNLLPDITIDAVKEHEIWFTKYLNLKNKKNEALERWRKNKNISQVKEDDENNQKPKIIFKMNDQDVHEKIAIWKAEKEAKRQQQNAYEQIKKEKMKQFKEEKRQMNHQIKIVVAKWRETKILKERLQQAQKELIDNQEKKIRSMEANKMIKQFQSQDDIFITRLRSTKLKEKNQTKKRSKSSYHVDRNPERIFKPTKQWLLRTSRDNSINDGASIFVPNIRVVPKLRVPEWRKNA